MCSHFFESYNTFSITLLNNSETLNIAFIKQYSYFTISHRNILEREQTIQEIDRLLHFTFQQTPGNLREHGKKNFYHTTKRQKISEMDKREN